MYHLRLLQRDAKRDELMLAMRTERPDTSFVVSFHIYCSKSCGESWFGDAGLFLNILEAWLWWRTKVRSVWEGHWDWNIKLSPAKTSCSNHIALKLICSSHRWSSFTCFCSERGADIESSIEAPNITASEHGTRQRTLEVVLNSCEF